MLSLGIQRKLRIEGRDAIQFGKRDPGFLRDDHLNFLRQVAVNLLRLLQDRHSRTLFALGRSDKLL
ncbi:hypothetical protein SDC9_199525 [bioreactor metagenome]|uniref:Uncharacterized protein n=1 Tax=bioreactor metagenome TaxID=1076179 RepID=A0A645IKN8_9ZZZZ